MNTEETILNELNTEELNQQIDLKNLVSITSQQFIKERESVVAGLVKGLFMKKKGLFEDILKMEKELNKKRDSLKQINDKIDKVRQGDWEVLKKLENENKGNKSEIKEENPE